MENVSGQPTNSKKEKTPKGFGRQMYNGCPELEGKRGDPGYTI